MTSPIERAARALCSLEGHPENIKFEGRPMWESYLPNARIVISAIREPSAAVLDALQVSLPVVGGDWEYLADDACEHWHAMIDALLAEK